MESKIDDQTTESLKSLLNEAKSTILQQEKDIGILRSYVKHLEAENDTHTRNIGTTTDDVEKPAKLESIDMDLQIDCVPETENELNKDTLWESNTK